MLSVAQKARSEEAAANGWRSAKTETAREALMMATSRESDPGMVG